MNVRRLAFVAILVLGTRAAAWSQTYTETTTRVETKPVMITGEVVRLEPGKTIVVRSGGEEVTYVLAPDIALPAEVQVGRSATLQLEPGSDGTSVVKRVKTTTVGSDGQVRETTEITRTDPTGQTSRTTMSTLTGRVESYMPGKSITVIDSKGARVTYVLSAETQVPSDVVMGKEVTVYVAPKEQPSVTYEIEKDGNTIKIKARTKQ